MLIQSCISNAMAADVLVMQGAKASAAIILTLWSWNILVSAPKVLIPYNKDKPTAVRNQLSKFTAQTIIFINFDHL